MLKIGHEVVRPGKLYGDDPVTIPVPEELETVPGIPFNNPGGRLVLPGVPPGKPGLFRTGCPRLAV